MTVCSSRHSRARFSLRPRLPSQSGAAVGTDRGLVIEIYQHRRVPHHRQQHVGEAAGDVWPDRLADERADHRRDLAASQADGEMVGPEPHQPLAKRGVGGEPIVDHRGEIVLEHLTRAQVLAVCRGHFAVVAPGGQSLRGAGSGHRKNWVWPVKLPREPCGGIVRERLLPPASEAEADHCLGCARVHKHL